MAKKKTKSLASGPIDSQWQNVWLPDDCAESKIQLCHAVDRIITELDEPRMGGLSAIGAFETYRERYIARYERMHRDATGLRAALPGLLAAVGFKGWKLPPTVVKKLDGSERDYISAEQIIRTDVLRQLKDISGRLHRDAELFHGFETGDTLPARPVRDLVELYRHLYGIHDRLQRSHGEWLLPEVNRAIRNFYRHIWNRFGSSEEWPLQTAEPNSIAEAERELKVIMARINHWAAKDLTAATEPVQEPPVRQTSEPPQRIELDLGQALKPQAFKIVSFLLKQPKKSAFWSDLPNECWSSGVTPAEETAMKALRRTADDLSIHYQRFKMILSHKGNGVWSLIVPDKSMDK